MKLNSYLALQYFCSQDGGTLSEGIFYIPMSFVLLTTVSLNLDQGEEYNIMWWSLSVTCDRSVVFSESSGFLHQKY